MCPDCHGTREHQPGCPRAKEDILAFAKREEPAAPEPTPTEPDTILALIEQVNDWKARAGAERIVRIELERAYACTLIDLAPRIGSRAFQSVPVTVEALVRQFAQYELDTCDRCGRRAPLRDAGTVRTDPSGTQRVCAWGCEVEP